MQRDNDCLKSVISAGEASQIWGLSRNAVSDAIRRGALPARKSGRVWLVTIADMLTYQHGRYFPDLVPDDLRDAFEAALSR